MTFGLRVLAVVVVGSLLAGGPVAPLAFAQTPTQPALPQPQMFQETLKAPEDRTAEGRTVLYPEAYSVAAGVATAVLIPGRIVTCTLGSGVGLGLLVLTLGSGYKTAMAAVEEGCGGKWVLNRTDLMPETPVTSPVVTTTPEPE